MRERRPTTRTWLRLRGFAGMLPSLKIVDEAGRLLMGLAQLLSGGWTGQPRAICLLDGRCKWPVYRSS